MPNKKSNLLTFFTLWVAANVTGFATFSLILIPIDIPGKGQGFGAAILLSSLQAVVLRKRLEVDGIMWFWSSLLTYTLSLILYFWGAIGNKPFLLILTVVALGLAGIAQKSVLRFYVKDENLWLVSSPIAAIVGYWLATYAVGQGYIQGSWDMSILLFWTIFGLIYGYITGLSLTWMAEVAVKERMQ